MPHPPPLPRRESNQPYIFETNKRKFVEETGEKGKINEILT
jgi:hypothetical protein